MKINIFESRNELFGILKSPNELLSHIDNVLLQLLVKSVNELKTYSFDELMDSLEECTFDELKEFIPFFDNDERLTRCNEIVLNKVIKAKV